MKDICVNFESWTIADGVRHKKGLGNFKDTIYWSNSEFGDTVAWYFDFEKGMDGTALKIFTCKIRLVLNIK